MSAALTRDVVIRVDLTVRIEGDPPMPLGEIDAIIAENRRKIERIVCDSLDFSERRLDEYGEVGRSEDDALSAYVVSIESIEIAAAPSTHGRPIVEHCCELLDTPEGYYHCNQPAEFILWGKWTKPEGLGPRCYKHAAKHVGDRALGSDLSYWAIFDLRRLVRLAESPPPTEREEEGTPRDFREPFALRIGGDLARHGYTRQPRGGDHKPEPPACALCNGNGDVVNPGNANPSVKVTDWLAPIGCPRCGQSGKDPNP